MAKKKVPPVHILCEELHRGGEVGTEHQRGASTTWNNLFTFTFVCVDIDLDLALFKEHSNTWNKDALVGLSQSQPRFLIKISKKVVNEIQVVLTFSLPCTIAAPRRSYCR